MRINVVSPRLLMDQHLIAEYGEIQNMMLPYYLRSRMHVRGFNTNKIPVKYTLGTGHASFFYDKMKFVSNRFIQVKEEMKHRGFKTETEHLDYSCVLKDHMNDYVVTSEDITVNMKRIIERIILKPTWYRYFGMSKDYKDLYEDYI